MFSIGLMLPLMVLGMFGVQTGMAADPSTLMETITNLKDEPVALVAIIVGSILVAVFIGHCLCTPSTGCSSLLETNEQHPVVIRGKQWIKKTEFEICPHPSHKKCPNDRDTNENQSVSDPLPQISKKFVGMFGQIKEAAADLKDWAEDRIKDMTKCPCDTKKENSPQLKDKLIQLNKAHQARQAGLPEQTDEVKPGQSYENKSRPYKSFQLEESQNDPTQLDEISSKHSISNPGQLIETNPGQLLEVTPTLFAAQNDPLEINPAKTRDDFDLPSPGQFNDYEPSKVGSQSGKISESKASSKERMKRPKSGQLNEENLTQSSSNYGPFSAFGSEMSSNGQLNGDEAAKVGSRSRQVSGINNLSNERPNRQNCTKEIVLTAVVCVICSAVLMTGLILLADLYSGSIVQLFNQALQAIRDVLGN